MDIIVKAAAAGIVVSVIALLIKKSNPELSFLIGAAGVVVILFTAAQMLAEIKQLLDSAAELSELSPAIIRPVIKCVGIGIITKVASELCKDAGQGAAAATVELAGAASALCAALPLIKTLLSMVQGLS